MSRLDERLLNHRARDRAKELRVRVTSLSEDERARAEEVVPGVLARVPVVLDYIEGALVVAAPELVGEPTLAALENSLTQAVDAANQGPEATGALDSALELALGAATPLVAATPVVREQLRAADAKFDSALEGAVRSVAEETRDVSQKLDQLEQRRQEAEAAVTQADDERRTSLTTNMDALEARLQAEQQRFDQLVPQFEQQFSQAQDARKEEFEGLRVNLTNEAEATSKKLLDEAEGTKEYLQASAQEVLADVQSRREDVEQLYGVITDTSTAGAFNTEAKNQKQPADTWRSVALGFGIAAAAIAIGAIVWSALDPDGGTSTSAVIAKVTATLAAAGIAAYAGRQSGRHREREEEAKRLELELVALGPFISDLDTAEQNEIRKEFVRRAFTGRPVANSAAQGLFSRKQDSFGLLTPETLQAIIAASARGQQP